MAERRKVKFLEVIGALSLIIGIILGGKELYDAFKGSIRATGTVTSYKSPPFLLEGYRNSIKYRSTLIRIAYEQKLPIYKDVDSIASEFNSYWSSTKPYSYDKILKDEFKKTIYSINYNTCWIFKIKNDGDSPIEELSLKLNTEGFTTIYFPDTITSQSFSNKIELGKLNPSYEIEVICWSTEEDYNRYYEKYKDFKLTHKNGWTNISYPKEKSRFMRGLSQTPSIFYILFASVIFFALYLIYRLYKNKMTITDASDEDN